MKMYEEVRNGKGMVHIPYYVLFGDSREDLAEYIRERGLLVDRDLERFESQDGYFVIGNINPCFL